MDERFIAPLSMDLRQLWSDAEEYQQIEIAEAAKALVLLLDNLNN